MPTELELIALNTEFDLYLPFSKRLVLNLPNSKDRTRAALWLQKLRSIKDDNFKKLRNEHLKLFLFALHRRSLVGIFEKPPPKDELESFHDGLTLMEMTRELIEITEKKEQQGGDNELAEGECPLPKVLTNISYDLKEYSAMQNIPKFGAHVFYAVSNEPMQLWKKSEHGEYPPTGDIPNQLQWEQVFAKLSDHVLEKQAEIDRRMEIMKMIEAGDASPDDLEPDIDFKKKIEVPICPPFTFKWKADSLLKIHQNYDFSDIKDADNIEVQGTWQLEDDEEAFHFVDDTTPGRRRIVIRDPYFQGLPADIIERRHHGIVEEIPEWEDEVEECDDECDDEFDNLWPPEQPADVCPCDQVSTCPCDIGNQAPSNNNGIQMGPGGRPNGPNSPYQTKQESSTRFAERVVSKERKSYSDRGYILDEKFKRNLATIQESNAMGTGQFSGYKTEQFMRQSQQMNYYPAQQSNNYFPQKDECGCTPKPQNDCGCPQVQEKNNCGCSEYPETGNNQEQVNCGCSHAQEETSCGCPPSQNDSGNQQDGNCCHSENRNQGCCS